VTTGSFCSPPPGRPADPPAARIAHEEVDTARRRRTVLRIVDPAGDVDLVHHWMHQAHVEEFWRMAWTPEAIGAYLRQQEDDPHRTALIGWVNDEPIGYLEVYDPAHDVLGQHYEVEPGDVGVHVLVGEERNLGRFTVSLGVSIMRYLFRPPEVQRVVGEPDARNHRMLTLLTFLGFSRLGEIELPDKRAALVVSDRGNAERLSGRRTVEVVR
jgi:acetyl CoA:N6-hydroxylysine acetyl transferase